MGYGLDIVGAQDPSQVATLARPSLGSVMQGAANPNQKLMMNHGGIARRQGLPFGNRQVIAAGATASFIARPQRVFRIERIVIASTGALSDLSVTDLKVGADSQVIDTGDLPGTMFSETAFDVIFRGVTADIGNTISMSVVNNGGANVTVSIGAVGEVLD